MSSSMTRDEVEAIVEQHGPHLRDDLRLSEWSITIIYDRLPEGVTGRVTVSAPYMRAAITLDPEQLDDEDEVLTVLRHELVHVFIWPMHAFGDSTGEMSSEGFAAWTFYLERLVRSVEQLLDARPVERTEA